MNTSGYKETEIGMIPDEWEVAALSEKYTHTRRPKGLKLEGFDSVPFVPMDLIPFSKIAFSNYILKKPQEISSGTYFEEGDILLSKITPSFENGKQGIIPLLPNSFGIATTEVIPIKEIPGVSDKHFLFYYLLKSDVRSSLAGKMEGSTGRQRLSPRVIENLRIPFPPLPEQRTIAAILSKIQQAIEAEEKIIERTKELKRALMAKLFTEGLHSEDLKDTEIGKMPKSWGLRKLEELVRKKVTDGTHVTPSYQEVGVPFITATNINNGRIDFLSCKFISQSEHQNLIKRCKPEMGDVLLSKVGTLGLVAKVESDQEFSIFVQVALIKPQPGVLDSDYLKYALSSPNMQAEILRKSSTSTMKYIGVGKIAKLDIPVPPMQEQVEIARSLSIIDNKIAHEGGKKKTLDRLLKSMLHQLMTGRIRVKDLEIPNPASGS